MGLLRPDAPFQRQCQCRLALRFDTADLPQLETGKWNDESKGRPVILRRRSVTVGQFPAPMLEAVQPDDEDRA